MRVIRSEKNVFFDVDETLVMHSQNQLHKEIGITDPYEFKTVLRRRHEPHIKLLKNYVAREFEVFVWSKNGYQWALSVLTALKLDHLPLTVLTKPCIFIDDQLPTKWMGEHVYIDPLDSFGK